MTIKDIARLSGYGVATVSRGVLVQVVDSGIPPRLPEQRLELLYQISKEQIHSALDNNGNAGAGLLL